MTAVPLRGAGETDHLSRSQLYKPSLKGIGWLGTVLKPQRNSETLDAVTLLVATWGQAQASTLRGASDGNATSSSEGS